MGRMKKFENRDLNDNYRAGVISHRKHENKLLINAMMNTGIKPSMFEDKSFVDKIKQFVAGWFSTVHPDPKSMDLDQKYKEVEEVFTKRLTL